MLDQYRNAFLIGLAALAAAAVVAFALERRDQPSALEIDLAEDVPTDAQVYIAGAVARPGVYQVDGDDRLVDLLYEAGGPAPDANLEAVNLALRLSDEDHVVIPRLGQPEPSGAASAVAGVAATGVINLNSASVEELDTLPGIGEVYSQRIVDSRTNEGPFTSVDDLDTRRIIPHATLERIRDLVAAP